jgi:tetratricopeptide (TPR) repeat protein
MLDFNGAIEDINKAIELEPSNWISYFSKGVTLSLFFENDNQALDAFSMAISLNPNAGEAYYYRGNVKLVLKDTIGACSDWRKALDLGITEATVFIDENCN